MNDRFNRRLLVVALVALAVASVGAGALAGSAAASTADASSPSFAAVQTQQTDVTANFTVTYNHSPGVNTGFYKTVTFENPEIYDPNTVYIRLTPGSSSTVLATQGLQETSSGEWIPQDGVDQATMELHVQPQAGDTMAALPSYNDNYDIIPEWEFDGAPVSAVTDTEHDLTISENETFATETFRNDGDVFFGPHTNVSVQSQHGTITLVVPQGVQIDEGAGNVTQALAELSDVHDVGRTHDEILVFPAPPHDGAGGTASILEHWYWTGKHNPVNTTTSAWYHEFMHMTDSLVEQEAATDFQWFTEAYASWYATLRPLEAAHSDYDAQIHQRIPYSQFSSDLEAGTLTDANLTNRTDWAHENSSNSGANYDQGLLTIGAIDRQIRLETGGNKTFADVVARLNQHSGAINHSDLVSAIFQESDLSVATQANQWITGEEFPEPWNATQHEAAFGYDPTVEPEEPVVDIDGVPSGNVTTGDTVSLDANVIENTGNVSSYEWTFGDGTTASGASVSHSYGSAGTYDVTLNVTNEYGLWNTSNASITVESGLQPHGEIDPSTTTASVGQSVGFGIQQNTNWITDIQWSMGDGTTYSQDWYVSHSYSSPGTYTVTLETQSGYDGTWTTDTVTVEVS